MIRKRKRRGRLVARWRREGSSSYYIDFFGNILTGDRAHATANRENSILGTDVDERHMAKYYSMMREKYDTGHDIRSLPFEMHSLYYQLLDHEFPVGLFMLYVRLGLLNGWHAGLGDLIISQKTLILVTPMPAQRAAIAELLALKALAYSGRSIIIMLGSTAAVNAKVQWFYSHLGKIFSIHSRFICSNHQLISDICVTTLDKGNSILTNLMLRYLPPPWVINQAPISTANERIADWIAEGTLSTEIIGYVGSIIVEDLHLIEDPKRGGGVERVLCKLCYISHRSLPDPLLQFFLVPNDRLVPVLSSLYSRAYVVSCSPSNTQPSTPAEAFHIILDRTVWSLTDENRFTMVTTLAPPPSDNSAQITMGTPRSISPSSSPMQYNKCESNDLQSRQLVANSTPVRCTPTRAGLLGPTQLQEHVANNEISTGSFEPETATSTLSVYHGGHSGMPSPQLSVTREAAAPPTLAPAMIIELLRTIHPRCGHIICSTITWCETLALKLCAGWTKLEPDSSNPHVALISLLGPAAFTSITEYGLLVLNGHYSHEQANAIATLVKYRVIRTAISIAAPTYVHMTNPIAIILRTPPVNPYTFHSLMVCRNPHESMNVYLIPDSLTKSVSVTHTYLNQISAHKQSLLNISQLVLRNGGLDLAHLILELLVFDDNDNLAGLLQKIRTYTVLGHQLTNDLRCVEDMKMQISFSLPDSPSRSCASSPMNRPPSEPRSSCLDSYVERAIQVLQDHALVRPTSCQPDPIDSLMSSWPYSLYLIPLRFPSHGFGTVIHRIARINEKLYDGVDIIDLGSRILRTMAEGPASCRSLIGSEVRERLIAPTFHLNAHTRLRVNEYSRAVTSAIHSLGQHFSQIPLLLRFVLYGVSIRDPLLVRLLAIDNSAIAKFTEKVALKKLITLTRELCQHDDRIRDMLWLIDCPDEVLDFAENNLEFVSSVLRKPSNLHLPGDRYSLPFLRLTFCFSNIIRLGLALLWAHSVSGVSLQGPALKIMEGLLSHKFSGSFVLHDFIRTCNSNLYSLSILSANLDLSDLGNIATHILKYAQPNVSLTIQRRAELISQKFPKLPFPACIQLVKDNLHSPKAIASVTSLAVIISVLTPFFPSTILGPRLNQNVIDEAVSLYKAACLHEDVPPVLLTDVPSTDDVPSLGSRFMNELPFQEIEF